MKNIYGMMTSVVYVWGLLFISAPAALSLKNVWCTGIRNRTGSKNRVKGEQDTCKLYLEVGEVCLAIGPRVYDS
jgi:hypothetical protein